MDETFARQETYNEDALIQALSTKYRETKSRLDALYDRAGENGIRADAEHQTREVVKEIEQERPRLVTEFQVESTHFPCSVLLSSKLSVKATRNKHR